ncbi:MAG: response regulator [Desulfobacterales bacterium]|nr:response regulator [Desulfobacterales bacterium]
MIDSSKRKPGSSVLFIEHDDAVREEMAPLLTELAPTVHFAVNKKEAEDLFQRRNPGVVISEAALKEADGVEIIQGLRDARPWIKLIVIASPADPGSLARAANAQIDHLLLKPVGRDALAEAVNACKRGIANEEKRARDLSGRLKLAESLERSQTPLAVMDGEGVITHANPALGSLTGRPAAELIGKKIDALQPPDAANPVSGSQLFQRTLADMTREEIDIVRKDGKIARQQVFISAREAAEEADQGYLAFFADFSRQKQEREALVEARKAAGDFLGLIPDPFMILMKSHEIMKGAVKDDGGLDAGAAREVLKLVGDAARRLRTILVHSRPEWRPEGAVEEAFTLHGLMEKIRRAARSRPAARGAKIFCKIPGYIPMALVGDASRIQQALQALINNSIRLALPERIEIGVDLKTKSEKTVLLQFSIANNNAPGAGKDRYDDLASYLAFVGEEDPGTRKPSLTEGLAMAKQLVEKMNGVLWIKSGAEKGRTFYLTGRFKLEREKSETAPGDAPPEEPMERPPGEETACYQILVAEDNKIDQKIVKRILEKMGHEVTTAWNGGEAVAAVEARSFDLILMDIIMPEVDGMKATRLIRKRERALGVAKNVPIIALTSHSLEKIRESCLASGMDACLAKPLQPEKAREIIHKLLHGPGNDAPAPPEPLPEPPPERDFNLEDLLETFDYDIDLSREIVLTFNIQAPSQLDKLKESLMGGDAALIEQLAEKFKGMAFKARAERLASAIASLERRASRKKHIESENWARRLDEGLAAAQLEMSHVDWEKAAKKAKRNSEVDNISEHIMEAQG